MATQSNIKALEIPSLISGNPKPHVDEAAYETMYKQSIESPVEFWDKVRNTQISSFRFPLDFNLKIAY